jgi:CheY-like chemotaxis protein
MHTILVADDSVTIQRAVEIVFDKEPFTVVKAGSGHEALARIREVRPHLVLADHTMPDQTGYDLAAALKADPSTSAIPVVLLSAAANPYDEARGGAAGVVSHVQKPFDCATLLDRVRGILGVEATAPGTAVPAAATTTAATANMPRPPSLGGFAGLGGGLPRPPAPSFPPRPAVAPPSTPPIPVAPAAIPRAPTPAPARDPFGLEAALSQPPTPAAPVASTPPTSVPLTSPTAVATVTPSGWTAVSPGQGIPQTPTPMPQQVSQQVSSTSTPATAHVELNDADFGFGQPAAPTPQPFSSTPTPAPQAVPAQDAAKVTAKLGLDAIAAAAEATPAPAATVAAAVGAVVAQAAPAIAASTGEAPSREALSAEARQIVERIAWEVVPELAETIIREELARLLKARGA